MTEKLKSATQTEWKKLVEEQKASGLSRPAFCRERGLRFTQFRYYYRRFKKEAQQPEKREGNEVTFVPVKRIHKTDEIKPGEATTTRRELRLRFPSGVICTVPMEAEIGHWGNWLTDLVK